MNKEFLKGLILFAAGFLAAKYLLKPATANSTNVTTTSGITADVNGVVAHVKEWLRNNMADVDLSEVDAMAAEATGVSPQKVAPSNSMIQESYPEIQIFRPPINQDYRYDQRGDNFLGGRQNYVECSPHRNDFFQAQGNAPRMGNIESTYHWTFN